MRTSILLTGALAASTFAAPQLERRTLGDVCKIDSCFSKLMEYLHVVPDFCFKFEANILNNEITGFLDSEVKSACSCVPKLTSTASGPVSTGASGSSAAVAITTTDAAKITAAAQTSIRKCKAPTSKASPTATTPADTSAPAGPTSAGSGSGPTSAAPTTEGAKPTSSATDSASPSASPSGDLGKSSITAGATSGTKPTGTGSAAAPTGTCPAPKIPGGDFDILGELSANAGMWLQSLTGSATSEIFSGVSKRTLTDGLSMSGAVSTLLGQSKGFVQITSKGGPSTQLLCQKAPLCKGKTYHMGCHGAVDLVSDATMQFQLAGSMTSPAQILKGGAFAGDLDWTFTWGGESVTVDMCILVNLAQDFQSIGLTNWHLEFASL